MSYFAKADESTRKAILADVDMTEESLRSDVNSLRDWLSKQPHLPKDTNESFLAWFIIGSKSLERAKERIDNYFTARGNNPTIFKDRNSDIIRKDKSLRPVFLSELTPRGERVVIMKSEDVDANDYDHAAHIVFALMMADILFRESGPCSGIVLIYDLKHFTSSHIARTNVFENARVIKLLQALPVRLKAIRFINAPSYVETIVSTFVKPFAPKKITQRVSITAEGGESLKDLPSSMLPTEYGGTSNKSCADIIYEEFKLCDQWEDWFKTEGSKVVDEDKRPSSSNVNTAYGVAGSFKKLNLD